MKYYHILCFKNKWKILKNPITKKKRYTFPSEKYSVCFLASKAGIK